MKLLPRPPRCLARTAAPVAWRWMTTRNVWVAARGAALGAARGAALGAALAIAGAAAAAELGGTLPDGRQIGVTMAPGDGGPGFVLERRLADGRPDPDFGRAGAQRFDLTPERDAPTALRVDAQGRIWIVGSAATADGERSVVLRFDAGGRPDTAFGNGGRAVQAPAGRSTRALEVQPLAGGGAWLAGEVLNGQGEPRLAVWRSGDSGAVDGRFGAGGVWVDDAADIFEILDLRQAPDGELALAVRRSRTELWTWRDGGVPVRAAVDGPGADVATPRLGWRDGRWDWSGQIVGSVAAVPTAPAGEAASAGGAAIATPFATAPDRRGDAAAAGGGAAELGWWLLLPLAALGGWWWWRRRG